MSKFAQALTSLNPLRLKNTGIEGNATFAVGFVYWLLSQMNERHKMLHSLCSTFREFVAERSHLSAGMVETRYTIMKARTELFPGNENAQSNVARLG